MAEDHERTKMRGSFMPELPFCVADRQERRVEPLCARPADISALAGSRGYHIGFRGEEFIRGRANAQSNWYWSSTTNANNTDNAWNVNMWNGNVNNDNKDNNNYVWPVRSGEWLPPLFSFDDLYRCYLKCRKNKRNTINALKFEANMEENLFILAEELNNGAYKPSRSVCFIDDFLILDESTEMLQEIKRHIEEFAAVQLRLSLNDKFDSIMPVGNGIDFLGYVVRQDYVLARRRVVNNLKAKLLWFKRRLILEQDGVKTVKYDYALLEELRAAIASYWGHLKWADSYNLRSALLERFNFLREYFICGTDGLKPIYEYRRDFPLVKFQYLYYDGIFPDAVIFFQVGSFYEFYGELAEDIKAALHLKPLKKNRREAFYGFPIQLRDACVKRLLEINKTVIAIKETGISIGKLRERIPVMKIQKMEVFV